MQRGKTIQIHLPDGNQRSVKIAEITTSIGTAIFIPRSKINEVLNRKELQLCGIYFLFGENDELGRPKVYIGEADPLITRIKQHNANKEFWNVAVAFISEKNNLNKAHVKFLENYCCNKAKEINRCDLENLVNPTKSTITEAEEHFVLNFYDDLKILLSTLGYPIFEESGKREISKIYYCKSENSDAQGEYSEDGFIVFRSSKSRINDVSSFKKSNWPELKSKLVSNGILKQEGNFLIFQEDFTFTSPSAAAAIVLGRSANGWTEWKNKEGKTLDEIERKREIIDKVN